MTGPVLPVPRSVAVGVPFLAVLAALAAMLGVSLIAYGATETQLAQFRLSKAAAVGRAVQKDLDRAIGYGIPLARIDGMGGYLEGLAERNPDLRFFAVTGADGNRLYYAGIGRRRLDPILAEIESRPDDGKPMETGGFLVLRLPLRETAGHVYVAVQPRQIGERLVDDLPRAVAGVLAVLLVIRVLATAALHRGFRAPLFRLAGTLTAGAAGRFDTLMGPRPRDAIGRAMLACNAVVQGLYDQRQRFVLHVDEVRGAVFEAEVAKEVERTRDRILAALGAGLSAPPQRRGPRFTGDGSVYAVLAPAAAVTAVLAALAAGDLPAAQTAVVGGVAGVAGVVIGAMLPAAGVAARSAAALLAVAAAVIASGQAGFAGILSMLLIAAAAGGIAVGAVLRAGMPAHRRARAAAILSLLQGVAIACLTGGLALAGDAVALGCTALALAVGAVAATAPPPVGRT